MFRKVYIIINHIIIKKVIFMNTIKRFIESKKAQLGIIEMKFLLIGVVLGIVLALAIVFLANKGVLPFRLTFLCPAIK